ncbi:MAG: nucleotidyltransferase domain-containing protein [bacterium]|nr:nucleotidyltransferase domain-containing protein [bacterium]
MKDLKAINNLSKLFKLYPKIKLVYLFGSRANGKIGPLSDYDFAVYLDEKDPKKRFDLRLELLGKITTKLKTENVDLCVLNDIDSPELKYNIIKDGILIFEKEPFKVLLEPKILNEYFDFYALLSRHKLTKA